jgi:immune inhibitor A
MKRFLFLSVALSVALVSQGGLTASGNDAQATGSGAPGKRGPAGAGHVKPLPAFVEKHRKERLAAADLVARGLAAPDADGVVALRNGRFVNYKLEGTEYLTAVLIDFTDVQHGQIPAPDRTTDNSSYWPADVSPAHYSDMLFAPGGGSYGLPSMYDFYLEQSSGRFTWAGQVSSWVQVTATEAAFGKNLPKTGDGGDDANGAVYRVVDAALKALAASGNYGGLDLAKADQIDRYDCDSDGVYNEPDGYIDHFGLVHAGAGEEAGGGAQGGDAIWSHSWYANFGDDFGPAGCQLGGYNLPGTNLWVGDYTIQPEDGGVGVFAHEFGHDLGLPDLYDTAAGENGTGYWTLMSSGSWASDSPEAIGDHPVHMGAWEKLALGWLGDNLARVSLGANVSVDLGPAEGATRGRYQALRVDLPVISKTITPFPVDGNDPNYFYSGQGDNIDTRMTKPVAAAAGTPISFRAMWDIETDWDYAYLQAQVGGVWVNVPTSASRTTNPNGQNLGYGITGATRGWTNVTATLPEGTTAYGFRYWTDAFVTRPGFAVDTISVGGVVDNATSTAGWTFAGFQQLTDGRFTQTFFHYYLAESRSYQRSDTSLCGAYNFLYGNWLEKQCYAAGLLIWYRNSSVPDNNTSQHPGSGQILPVDAHPIARIKPDGKSYWNGRWQAWDATFGVDPNAVTLSQVVNGGKLRTQTYTAPPASSFFDASTTSYFNPSIPYSTVKTAGSGLKIDITGVSDDRGSYQVHVYK